MEPPGPRFLLLGSASVVLTRTVGLWVVRRVAAASLGAGLGDGGHTTLFAARDAADGEEKP